MCEMYDDTYNMNTLHLDMYYMQSTRSFEMCRSIRTLSTIAIELFLNTIFRPNLLFCTVCFVGSRPRTNLGA